MRKTRATAKTTGATILVRPSPLGRSRAIVQFGPLRLAAAIGRAGRTVFKREGDGGTPVAPMRLLHGFVRRDRVGALQTGVPMRAIRKGMLWCDAPADASYNRPVRAPFAASHEQLLREDGIYDICLVLDWNIAQRRRHRGSAIFFHLIRPGYAPTAGCIAISLADMKRLLRFATPRTTVTVV